MTVKKNFYRIRGFVKDFLRIQFGVEFIRYPLHRWIRQQGISLVIDIGANRGQFAQELLRSGFRDRIVSIEPNPKAFKVLSMEAGRHENWLACNEAVGEIEGERILHITKSDASASFYSVRAEYSDRYLEILSEQMEVPVPVRALDDLGPTYASPGDNVFVKVDVQGAELDVIRGGKEFLKACLGIQIELALCLCITAPQWRKR